MTEQAVEVPVLVCGMLCSPLTKFPLHFANIHRCSSCSLATFCAGSFRKLGAFAGGVVFYSSCPTRRRLSRLRTTTPLPPLLLHLCCRLGHRSFQEGVCPLPYFPSTLPSLEKLPVFNM